MSEIVSESDIELGNVFQQIFMECDTSSLSTSMTYSTLSLGDEVPISKIVRYVQEQLPIWSPKHMLELWKCLSNVSTNDRVNLIQFKEATKCWIAKVLQTQTQDDNNNIEKELYKSTNGTKMDSMKTNVDKDITEAELRLRLRKFDEENIILREELARTEEIIANLERKRSSLKSLLNRYTKKYQQLEKENDEQKDKLNEMIKSEKNYISKYQRCVKKCESLSKQLEAAEIENQAIQPLKEEMEKINKKKRDCMIQVARLQEEFCEKEEECEKFTVMLGELQDTNCSMKEAYEHTVNNLREKNRQLADANMELQSLSSTPNKLEKVPLENSLYAELRASGFAAECSNTCRLELEEELEYYDTVISTTLEQLDKIIQSFAMTSDFTDSPLHLDSLHAENAKVHGIEILKQKVAFLLNMVNEKIARSRNTRDWSTQLHADCSGALESSEQFGITSFRAGLSTRAQQYPKAATNLLRSIASQSMSDNEEDDLFLKVIRAKTNVQAEDHNIVEVIDPIFDELDRIIEQTIHSPVIYKDLPASGNSRYRSIYKLPSSPLNAEEDTKAQATGSCQSSRKDSLDAALASGDGLTRAKSCGSQSAEELETTKSARDGEESPKSQPEEEEAARASEMSKILSALRMDSVISTKTTTSTSRNLQAPEVTVTSPLTTSPRRKFSVYSRSFDVVEVREPREDQDQGSPCLQVRRSLSNSSIQGGSDEEKTSESGEQNGAASGYLFGHSYRNSRHSDSSNSCSPQRQFWDGPADNELSPTTVQSAPIKVYLAPMRLQLPRKSESESVGETDYLDSEKSAIDRAASSAAKSDVAATSSFITADSGSKRDDNDASVRSHSNADRCETAASEFNSRSANESFSQDSNLTLGCATLHNRIDSARIIDPEDPHFRASARRQVKSDQRPRVERPPVDSQMSSREDTSAGDSDSECESARLSDRCVDQDKEQGVTMGASEVADQTADAMLTLINTPTRKKMIPCEKAVQNDDGRAACDRNLLDAKQERRQRRLVMRRSFSEGDGINGRTLCRCRQQSDEPQNQNASLIQTNNECRSFPSLTNDRLQQFGLVNFPDTMISNRENLSEFELQKRYIAFSLCLCTDRGTLPQRMELSLRQRDQSERNLACEVQKMQQDIQELAPLCTDRESVERVERVRYQLDMVARCAHRVSCVAETLGAVHQEHRISWALFFADRYLQLLQSRCEKLAANVAETKRILTENNIVIEENSGELGDDLPRIRYRSGTPANNRMMMARRRASIATMSRPMGTTQDVIKDTVRQRNSVSGRVTLRRPSLNYESSKWENERLGRTDSSSSISELRGIFEHAESRRSSREENNNMLQLNQSNNQNIINCAIIDDEIWTNQKQESSPDPLPVEDDVNYDCRHTRSFQLRGMAVSWRVMLWGILIFFLGFYVNHIVSDPSNQQTIERIFKRYFRTRNVTPHPM